MAGAVIEDFMEKWELGRVRENENTKKRSIKNERRRGCGVGG